MTVDIFGTTVDWRSGVAEQVAKLAAERGVKLDSGALSDRTRLVSLGPPMGGMGQGDMGQMDHGASGAMPGMMSGDQMRQMGRATGDAFDRMFLQMMIAHHQGAVTMGNAELADGQNPDARQLAQRIINAQQREITEMQTLLGG